MCVLHWVKLDNERAHAPQPPRWWMTPEQKRPKRKRVRAGAFSAIKISLPMCEMNKAVALFVII